MSTNPTMSKGSVNVQGRELTVERVFDAPRDLLFTMWKEPKHLANWWGPKGWTLPVCEVDFRPGGVWRYCMRGPDGTESWGRATYREITSPERIVYEDAFADEHGNALEGMPQMVITVELIALGSKTKLKSTTLFASVEELEKTVGFGMVEGMNETFDRLDEYLVQHETANEIANESTNQTTQGNTMSGKIEVTTPSDREIRMSRVFDAPRDLVFKAMTDPNLIPQWWGLNSTTTVIDKFDFRVGGQWRFVQRAPDGSEHGFRGEFREIAPPDRFVQTFEWEGMPGHIIVESMSLEDLGGKTRVTNTSHFDSVEDRDGMLSSGMEVGANESWDRLAALLAKQV